MEITGISPAETFRVMGDELILTVKRVNQEMAADLAKQLKISNKEAISKIDSLLMAVYGHGFRDGWNKRCQATPG